MLEVTDKDAIQLTLTNRYIINSIVNKADLQKLDTNEHIKYWNEFWEASNKLKQHNPLAE